MAGGDSDNRAPTDDLPQARDAFARRDGERIEPAAVARAATVLTLSGDQETTDVVQEARELLDVVPVETRLDKQSIAEHLSGLPGRPGQAGEALRHSGRGTQREFAALIATLPDSEAASLDNSEHARVISVQAEAAVSLFADTGNARTDPGERIEATQLIAASLFDPHPLVRVAASAAVLRQDNSNPLAAAILRDAQLHRTEEISLLAAVSSARQLDNRYRRVVADTGNSPHPDEPDSVVVHGTWARKRKWWTPDGSLCTFLREAGIFPKLYCGSDPFVWSGFYSFMSQFTAPTVDWDHLQAGGYLAWWAERRLADPPDIIGHSYGASISMSATKVEKYVRGFSVAVACRPPKLHPQSCLLQRGVDCSDEARPGAPYRWHET